MQLSFVRGLRSGLVPLALAVLFLGASAANATWKPLGPFSSNDWYVLSISIDPSSPSTLYAGTKGFDGVCGVFKSLNNGFTWDVVNILSDSDVNADLGVVALAID